MVAVAPPHNREGTDVAHHVVPQFFFQFSDPVKVDILKVLTQFSDLLIGDGQSQSLFIFGEGEPETAPGGVFVLGGPDTAHLFSGVTPGKRIVVGGLLA